MTRLSSNRKNSSTCYTASQNPINASMTANVPTPSAITPTTNIIRLRVTDKKMTCKTG